MVNWYPGHMARAKRRLKDDLKLVDMVIEMLDARIPASSRNPEFDDILRDVNRIIVLNKKDLASSAMTKKWKVFLQEKYPTLAVNAREGDGVSSLIKLIKGQQKKLEEKARQKGKIHRDIRIMIIGIPNVGKSALINAFGGKGKARTGDKPGVTRGEQWINIDEHIKLMDTPGILWPNIEDETSSYNLAITGAIDPDRYDEEIIAYHFVKYLLKNNPTCLTQVYPITVNGQHPYDVFLEIGRKRGCLMSGGRVDKERVSRLILTDYRDGKFGQITLEDPKDWTVEGSDN